MNIVDYNNYVHEAQGYLSLKRQLAAQGKIMSRLEYKLEMAERTKNATALLSVGAELILIGAVVDILKTDCDKALSKTRNYHRALLGNTGRTDGQHTIVMSHSWRRGSSLHAPMYGHEDVVAKSSYTRHIKNGKGHALIFGDLLPVLMDYS